MAKYKEFPNYTTSQLRALVGIAEFQHFCANRNSNIVSYIGEAIDNMKREIERREMEAAEADTRAGIEN